MCWLLTTRPLPKSASKSPYSIQEESIKQTSAVANILGNISIYRVHEGMFYVLSTSRGTTCSRYLQDLLFFGPYQLQVDEQHYLLRLWGLFNASGRRFQYMVCQKVWMALVQRSVFKKWWHILLQDVSVSSHVRFLLGIHGPPSGWCICPFS